MSESVGQWQPDVDEQPELMERQFSQTDVPDALWPTDNVWGVPLLDKHYEAWSVNLPVVKWGSIRRRWKMHGTWHFYTDDYKFSALWKNPSLLLNSQAVNIVEPNCSTNIQMPRAEVLHRIYQKRWLARLAQSQGMRVFVDMNVDPEHFDLNLLGVPVGWRAYATRAIVEDYQEYLPWCFDAVCERAETDSVLFLVVGGRSQVAEYCGKRGWVHVAEGHGLRGVV